NVASMRRMLAPLTARVGERMSRSAVAPLGRSVAATELGVLLGWFAQRVLGQYDLLVPDEGADSPPDAVYYVGPNVLALEKRFAFRPRDFRRWIALHEVTHRAQFTGIPWMRDYFLGLVQQALGSVDADPRRLVRALARAALDRGAPWRAQPGAGADVGARGPRQPRHERARPCARRRSGADGQGAPG